MVKKEMNWEEFTGYMTDIGMRLASLYDLAQEVKATKKTAKARAWQLAKRASKISKEYTRK